jgi:membrane-bound lytic murein transglycosylase B
VVAEAVAGSDAPVVHDDRVDDELAAVPVVGPAVVDATTRYRADESARRTAVEDEERARRELADLAAARQRLEATVTRSTRRRDKSAVQLASLRRAIAAIAVEAYVQGNSTSSAELDLSAGSATRARARRSVSAAVQGRQIDDARLHAAALAEATAQLDTAQAELGDVTAREHEQTAAADDARARQDRLAEALAADARAVADARLTAEVRGSDLVLVALDAYHHAARTMGAEQPACAIHWSLLAGVGKTESGHGTFRGARVEPNGAVSRPIIGIPLDGSNGTARIGDTDGGALDGDAELDRAVGPMQFIPSTWARWARDGNGDGRADPQNLYDAALTAAAYLCAAGPGLDGEAAQRSAVLTYNADASYVDTVVGRAAAYRALRLV